MTAMHPAHDRGPHAGITPFVPDWAVALQPEGAGRPVFVFPPAHGVPADLEIEAGIAGHVGREHPFWGLCCDAACVDLVRAGGSAALGVERAQLMQAIQGSGPFLLYGTCFGGYAAWETARQLLEAGEEIAGICFFEAPLRSSYRDVLPPPAPAHGLHPWRLTHYYPVSPLPVHLTHIVTAGWRDNGWWKPWREVALGSYEVVVVPGETETAFERREERIARHVREWIETAERRVATRAARN